MVICIHGWLCNLLDVTIDCHDRYSYHQHHNCEWSRTKKRIIPPRVVTSIITNLQTKMRTIMTTKIVLGTHSCMCMHGDYTSNNIIIIRIPLLNRYTQTNFGRRWEQYFPLDTWRHRDSPFSLLAWDSRNLRGTRCTLLDRFPPGTDQVGTPYRTDHHLLSCICLKWDKRIKCV